MAKVISSIGDTSINRTSELINDGENSTSRFVEEIDLAEQVPDAVGNALTDTSTIDFTYNDIANTITADVKPNSITATQLADNINISEFINDSGYELTSNKGLPNGYPSLDGGGKIPVNQLPNSVMEYKGVYDASTNTPTLVNGVGNTGDVYRTTVAGAGVNGLNFVVGDYATYNGTVWEKAHSGADNITSVFGRLGTVTAQNGDYTASQITNVPSGNISSTTVQAALNELDSEVIHKTGDETKTGNLTVNQIIKSGAPSTNILLAGGSDITQASLAPSISHNSLAGLQLAGAGVTYGHITDGAQNIKGNKTVSDNFTAAAGFTVGTGNMAKPGDQWITLGTSVTNSAAYSTPAAEQLNLILLNYGVSGSDSNDLVNQYVNIPTLNSGNQDLYRYLSIEHGINDSSHSVPLATYRANLVACINNAKSKNWPNNKIILINGNYCTNAPMNTTLVNYANEAMLIAKEQGIQYFDAYNYTLNNGAGSLLTDGVHPSTAGGKVYARGLIASLQGGGEFSGGLTVDNGLVVGGIINSTKKITTLGSIQTGEGVNNTPANTVTGDIIVPKDAGMTTQHSLTGIISRIVPIEDRGGGNFGISLRNYTENSSINMYVAGGTRGNQNLALQINGTSGIVQTPFGINSAENINIGFNKVLQYSGAYTNKIAISDAGGYTVFNNGFSGGRFDFNVSNGVTNGSNLALQIANNGEISVPLGDIKVGTGKYIKYVASASWVNKISLGETSGNLLINNGYSAGTIDFNVSNGVTNSENLGFRINNDRSLHIPAPPTTSAGTYDILTRSRSTGVVEKILSSSVTPSTRTININGVTQNLSADRSYRAGLSDTGALLYAGSSVASATTVNIGAVTGIITDNETNPNVPSYQVVTYAGGTNITVPTLGSGTGTYVLLNNAGTLVFQNTYPTSAQRKSMIYLSKISHPNLSSISFIIDEPDFVNSPLQQFRDLFQVIQYMNQGITISGNAGLTINSTNGVILGDGINFVLDKTNPNMLSVASGAPRNFLLLNQSGAVGSFVTTIDPANYDVGGVTTPIGGSVNSTTIQYLYYAPGVGFAILRGQTVYGTLLEAVSAVGRESFILRPNLVNNSILIAAICLRRTTTAMNDPAYVRILLADKFGQIGGASSGISVTNLQTAYNNSLIPQILTSTTLGAVTLRNGGALDTDNVFAIQNLAGSNTLTINGNGLLSATNTGVTQISGLNLTNNGTSSSRVLHITNASSGIGQRILNSSTGAGLSIDNDGTGSSLVLSNNSTGVNINNYNNSTGTAYFSNNVSTGILMLLNSQTSSTGDLLSFRKNGILSTKIDHLGVITSSPSVSASSALARGQVLTPTLTATDNNDVLVGLDINPTFNKGAFTGISQVGIKMSGNLISMLSFNSGISVFHNAQRAIGNSVASAIYSHSLNSGSPNILLAGSRPSAPTTNAFSLSIETDNSIQFDNTNAAYRFKATGTEYFRIFSNGNTLLQNGGTFTDAGYRLDIQGTTRLSNTVTLGTLPTTSAGTYDILTRNTSNGVVEKINSTSFATITTGTFSPSLIDTSSGATYSYTVVEAFYTKIGNFIQLNLTLGGINTTGTPTGDIRITNLPFNQGANAKNFSGTVTIMGASSTFYSICSYIANTSTSFIEFRTQTALDGNNNSSLTACSFTSGQIQVSISYSINN